MNIPTVKYNALLHKTSPFVRTFIRLRFAEFGNLRSTDRACLVKERRVNVPRVRLSDSESVILSTNRLQFNIPKQKWHPGIPDYNDKVEILRHTVCKSLDRTFERGVATKLTQIKTAEDSNY